jgi:hypothetical protein
MPKFLRIWFPIWLTNAFVLIVAHEEQNGGFWRHPSTAQFLKWLAVVYSVTMAAFTVLSIVSAWRAPKTRPRQTDIHAN